MKRGYHGVNQSSFHILHRYLSENKVNWFLVRNCLNQHPQLAAAHDQSGASALCKALYRPIDDYPPLSIVRQLLEAYPAAVWDDNPRFSVLFAACSRRASHEILKLLVESRPSRPTDREALWILWISYRQVFGAESLVSRLVSGGREGAQIWVKFHLLIEYLCNKPHTMTSYRSLHAAASTPTCSAELLDLSISLFPNQVRELDEWGNLPLHYLVSKPACKHQHDHSGYICKLKKLLELFPQGASYRDGPSSQLAIHLAIENGHEWDMIRPLVNAFPESLTKPDVTQGLYAFQLAAYSKDSSLTATFELLRAAPYVLSLGQAHGGQKTEGSKPLPLLGSTPQPECNTEYVLRDIQGSGDSASISKVWRLLQFRVQGDLSPWKVLHSVASLPVRECPLALLEITLQIHGYELGEADRQGNLPLHIVSAQELEGIDEFSSDFDDMEDDACDPRTERVKVVVRDYPNAASIYDSNGLLPLHLAIYARHPWQSLQALLRAYPAAICQRGRRGLYPFQIAAARDAGLTEIFELILSAPHLLLDNSNEEEQPP